MAHVKAAAILARIAFIQKRFGEAGYEQVLAALSRPFQERLRQLILPQEWLPIELMTSLIDETDRIHGKADGALCREMARYAAEANLTTLYKIFFRVTSAAFILDKARALWGVHYDSGRLELERFTPKHLALRVVDFETPSCTHCQSVFSWAERSIELSGGKNVQVGVSHCRKRNAAACECQLRFE